MIHSAYIFWWWRFIALLRQHYTFHGQGKALMEQQDGEAWSTMHSYSLLTYHLSSDSQKYLSCHYKYMLKDIGGVILLLIRPRQKVLYCCPLSCIIHSRIGYVGSYWSSINQYSLTKWRHYQSVINILTLWEGFHSEGLTGHLWKVDPN